MLEKFGHPVDDKRPLAPAALVLRRRIGPPTEAKKTRHIVNFVNFDPGIAPRLAAAPTP